MRPFLPVFSVSLAYNTEFVAVFSVPGPEAVGMEQEGIFPSLSSCQRETQQHPLASPRAVEAPPGPSPSHFQPVHRTTGC